MQFNSYEFVLMLLPSTLLLYFLCNRIHQTAGKFLLIIASIVFYTDMEWAKLTVLAASIVINYLCALTICHSRTWRRFFTVIPVIVNIGLLLWYKYQNFAIENVNVFFGTTFALRDLALPMGISFFTFQQIAYVVSVFRGEIEKPILIDYLAYILYFPKLLLGPLMEPTDFLAQINDPALKRVNWENILCGVKIFSFGLLKKMILADTFAGAVTWGFSHVPEATAMDWIFVMMANAISIYFDFSGYSDMAVGASLMLNITLPINFDSPYKALSIREVWKRWHISLTSFLTKYLYYPLGGSRKGKWATWLNTLIVFSVSGLWHGANWTYLAWGVLNGCVSIFERETVKLRERIYEPVQWGMTFLVWNVQALLFSSYTVRQWASILKVMLCFQSTAISEGLMNTFSSPETGFFTLLLPVIGQLNDVIHGFWFLLFFLVAFLVILVPENNYRSLRRTSPGSMIMAAVAFAWGVICLGSETVFVYVRF